MPRFHLALAAVLLFVVTVLAPAPAAAQPTEPSGFPFLRLEASARAAALGGSYGAVYGDDVNGLWYNPALLNASMHRGLSVSYLNHLSDMNAGFAAYAHDVDGLATLAVGLRAFSYGEFDGRSETGEETGTFSGGDVALTLGAGRTYAERLRVGVALHAVYSSIDQYDASALAADAGLLYQLPEARLAFSASVNNLGVTLSSLGRTRDDLPLDVRVGVTRQLRYLPLLVTVTGYNLHDPGAGSAEDATAVDDVLNHIILAGEFRFSEAFQVRLGYNHRRHEELKSASRLDTAGLSFGAGIGVAGIRFDYAFNSWSETGGLHQLTLRTTL